MVSEAPRKAGCGGDSNLSLRVTTPRQKSKARCNFLLTLTALPSQAGPVCRKTTRNLQERWVAGQNSLLLPTAHVESFISTALLVIHPSMTQGRASTARSPSCLVPLPCPQGGCGQAPSPGCCAHNTSCVPTASVLWSLCHPVLLQPQSHPQSHLSSTSQYSLVSPAWLLPTERLLRTNPHSPCSSHTSRAGLPHSPLTLSSPPAAWLHPTERGVP